MECLLIAGYIWLVGTDWNGDRYMLNAASIVSMNQDMSISDTDDQFMNMRPKTYIQTLNGIIVEDMMLWEVGAELIDCEKYLIANGE